MKWWAYIAIKQLFPTGRPISFFAVVSVLCVAVGVLALFGTQSVMNGFHHEIERKLIDTGGDLSIRADGKIIGAEADAVIEKLKDFPEVEKVEKVAMGGAMLLFNNTPAYQILRTYDTIAENSVIPFDANGFVYSCSMSDLDDDGIILNYLLMHQLRLSVGDTLEVYTPNMYEKRTKDEVLLPVKLKVIGYFSTGFSEFDKNFSIVSLRRMQDIYSLGDGYHSIAIKLKNDADSQKFADMLNKKLLRFPLKAASWLEGNAEFLRVIITEKVMMSIIMTLIIIVAAFSIFAMLYTSVLRKTKEIGLQAAMGARGWEIAASYCLQGFLCGVLGVATGFCFTFLLLHFRDPIAGFIVGRETLSKFYMFSNLPVKYDLIDAATVAALAIVLCTLAGLLPAMRAARLKVSEAMRND